LNESSSFFNNLAVVVVVVKVSCMMRRFHFSRKTKIGACSDGKG